MILTIGEILFDQFPEYRKMGGAPFNYSVHCSKLGLPVRFISRVGDDKYGREILQAVKALGFETDDIQADTVSPTGIVDVSVDSRGEPSFNIRENAAYDNIDGGEIESSVDMKGVDLIYTGTLIQRSDEGFRNIQNVLEAKREDALVFYDVNLRPRCFRKEIIAATLAKSDIVKLNRDELLVLKDMFDIKGDDNHCILELSNDFGVPAIAVTNGSGEIALYENDVLYRAAPPKVDNFQDAVGAGDAFGAALTAGLLMGADTGTVLEGALKLSSYMCTVQGAIPPNNEIYNEIKEIFGGR